MTVKDQDRRVTRMQVLTILIDQSFEQADMEGPLGSFLADNQWRQLPVIAD